MNEFEIKLPSEYFHKVFGGQKLFYENNAELGVEMNGFIFKLYCDQIEVDVPYHGQSSHRITGQVVQVKSEEDKLQEQLDNLIKEVESVKEKLRDMK